MSKRKLPAHIHGTIKAWRTQKRKELDDVLRAIKIFRLGCAYTPAKDIGVIMDKLTHTRQRLSVKEWK